MAREVGGLEGPLERLVVLSRTATFLSTLAGAYVREGRAAEASLIEQELEERAVRGEYIPAIAQLMIAVARPDTAGAARAPNML